MKIKSTVIALILLAIIPFSSNAQTIKGNEKIKTDVRSISGFNRLVVQGQAELYVTQESAENVKIEADENLIELLQTSVNNGVLYVIVPNNIKKAKQITISVAYRNLKQIILMNEIELKSDRANSFDDIEIICGNNAKVNFEFTAKNASIKAHDFSNVALRGYAETLLVESTDDTELNAFDLQSDVCTVVGSGYAEISVNVKKSISIVMSGSSNLFLMGEPAISQRIFNSSGLITKRRVGSASN